MEMEESSAMRFMLLQDVQIAAKPAGNVLKAGTLVSKILDENGQTLVECCEEVDVPETVNQESEFAQISNSERANKLLELTHLSFKLLLAEAEKGRRVATAREGNRLQEASRITVGSRVSVFLDRKFASVLGTVQFIGPISETKAATCFGIELDDVELPESVVRNLSDGTPFFQSDSHRIIFVSICKLRPAGHAPVVVIENPSAGTSRKRKDPEPEVASINKRQSTLSCFVEPSCSSRNNHLEGLEPASMGCADSENEVQQLKELKTLVTIFKASVEEKGISVTINPDSVSGHLEFRNLVRSTADSDYSLGFFVGQKGSAASGSKQTKSTQEEHTVIQHCPPFFINFRLTPDCLNGSVPIFEPHCTWLPLKQVSNVKTLLDSIWSKQKNRAPAERLTRTIVAVKAQLLSTLGVKYGVFFVSPAVVELGLRDPGTPGLVVCADDKEAVRFFTLMKTFHEREEDRWRKQNQFECQICAMEVSPEEVTFFSVGCQHIFCRDCVTGHVKAQIDAGNDKAIGCPGSGCKMTHMLVELADVIPPDVMAQLANQLLERTLAAMDDIFRCSGCQRVWILEMEDLGDERYITCQDPNGEGCGRQYCRECKGFAHGDEPCATFEEKHQLKLRYESATPEEKAKMEEELGREKILHTIADYDSEIFIRHNLKICPSCKAPVQKSYGCNVMSCTRCNTKFCYGCGIAVCPKNPYVHVHACDRRRLQRPIPQQQ